MKYLNLSEGFNPYNAPDKDIIEFESFTFSGGEPHIKLKYDYNHVLDESERTGNWMNVMITHRINSFNDLGLLMVAVDALRKMYPVDELFLFMPYLPGARQDRIMVAGEALTVKVYTNIINSLEFEGVLVFDPHSDVGPALLDSCKIIGNHLFVEAAMTHIESTVDREVNKLVPYLVSPDAGANKKILSLAKHLDHKWIVKCDKTREISTGKITNFEVYSNNLQSADCIIVDDICDGGGTFLGLAEELKKKNAGNLYLIVSHGIFSKGFKELSKHFKYIYTTDSICNDYSWENPQMEKGSEIVTQIKLKDVI